MTQAEINRLREIPTLMNKKKREYEAEIGKLGHEMEQIFNNCDHKYPDGSSAIREGSLGNTTCAMCSKILD